MLDLFTAAFDRTKFVQGFFDAALMTRMVTKLVPWQLSGTVMQVIITYHDSNSWVAALLYRDHETEYDGNRRSNF